MEDYLSKVVEGFRKQLIAAGEIGPDEKLSPEEIQQRYSDFQIKKVKEQFKALGVNVPEPVKQTPPPEKKKEKGMTIDDARQLFLDNPELASMIQKAAKGEIQRGQKKNAATKAMDTGAGKRKQGSSSVVKPREGLVHALEQLVAKAQDGYNNCMIVVDGCWINYQNKRKKKQLYCQVAGDKYIPKKSHLGEEHVKILEGMGITREKGSIDIFSMYYNNEQINIPEIAQNTFKIFDEVLRVSKGASAYIELVLGSKPTPEFDATLASLEKYLPDRRDQRKFYWNWL